MDSKTTGQQTTGQQEKAEVVSGLVVSGRNQPDLEGANCLGHWELSEPLFLGAQFPIGKREGNEWSRLIVLPTLCPLLYAFAEGMVEVDGIRVCVASV
ncbi:MAG: hypothetical protein IMHGJWDQ_000171 [Candidatus Fervidibacter sp.]